MIVTEQEALYTGITKDIERRFQQHLDVYLGVPNSKGAKFFRGRKPLAVKYQKRFDDRSAASRHEYQLKQLNRQQKLQLILGESSV